MVRGHSSCGCPWGTWQGVQSTGLLTHVKHVGFVAGFFKVSEKLHCDAQKSGHFHSIFIFSGTVHPMWGLPNALRSILATWPNTWTKNGSVENPGLTARSVNVSD